MIYPKKTPAQSKQEEQTKKIINQQQREQLKAIISQKFLDKYPNKNPETIQGKIDNFFESRQTFTSGGFKELDQYIAQSEKLKSEAAYSERDDISVKSGVSKMSGATSLAVSERRKMEARPQTTIIDLNFRTQKSNIKTYRNEEEEWAEIYKHNQQVYKAEAELEEERKKFQKDKYRSELNEQVDLKKLKKWDEFDEKRIDYEQVMLKVQKGERQEKRKADLDKAKVMYEKEMRDKQIKEIKAQKRQELKEEKQLDAYIISRIKQEQLEDMKVAKKIREEESANFRKILQENEENRLKMIEEKAKERKEEIRLIEEQNRLIEEREKARDEEAKAKDRRIREQIEAGKNLLGKPSNERERRQEMKVQKWADRKEQEELEQELRQKQLLIQRNLDNKAYLDKQVEDKKLRMKEEYFENNAQARIWQNSTAKYGEWEKQKAEARKDQMKEYANVLKAQMQEKFDERRVTDRLFNLRATMYERKRSVPL